MPVVEGSWTLVGRSIVSPATRLITNGVPRWLLRRWWPERRLQTAIEIFADPQAPRFCVRQDRPSPELLFLAFLVYNLSPIPLRLLGADLTISLDGTDFMRFERRFPSEILAPPHARSGFVFPPDMSDSKAARLRAYPREWANLQVSGAVVVGAPYGEFRKDMRAVLAAIIDR